ncbi:MAG: HAMP domain-containing histidine kinase [Gammaproteobacteria bacterium]|nr:HAMP domain-containing histidine kinase [Gammaproteobacteria bacterium]MBQ0841178.1 HAMP domain-containing histidine kinase [Gammaproteobacteria bacterium]
MRYKRGLARRIVFAFVAITLVVSGAFALSLVYVVGWVETHLVSEESATELNEVLSQDLSTWQQLDLDAKTHFYTSDPNGPAIPANLTNSHDGFTELVEGDQAFYVFQQTQHGQRYLLVKEQHDFERREQVLYDGVLGGFIFSVLAASVLGWLLARQVIAPVARLARQVRHSDQLLPMAPALAADYANDEVGQLAAAFDTTLEHLRHTLDRERFFTSDVSHELRTPLMVIASSCELLLEEDELSTSQHKQLERIQKAGSEIHELVETFLLLARGDSQSGDTAVRVSLATAAEAAIQRFSSLAQAKGLRLVSVIEANDTGGNTRDKKASYNASFLAVVMANLLRNAMHYTDTGEIRLILVEGGFRVEDTGIGVSSEQQADIFDPFYRADPARGDGLGLGLSIVRRVCEHQGWAIHLRALVPSGSCFVVDLRA